MGKGKKVVVAMSGGVDSSVAAALLQRAGYECIGVFMRLGTDGAEEACGAGRPTHKQGCCSVNDAADARFVAGLLKIPFYSLNFQEDFGKIIDYFVQEYNRGRTPNPCIRCNEQLKFGKLSRYARAVGADYVATGHYARIEREGGSTQLLRGRDHAKDQSYVLFGMPPEELDRMLLPIGELAKSEVRRLAAEFGLPVHDKPDSQEICFVPDDDYFGLVQRRTPEAVRPGAILDMAGKVVGQHPGHQAFTLGKRKGIGVALGRPVYVTRIDPAANTVTLGNREDLLRRRLRARGVNWLAGPCPTEAVACAAKVRYNSPPAPATVLRTGPDEITVCFAEPIAAITPGQAVVCYDGERVLGGAWIEEVFP